MHTRNRPVTADSDISTDICTGGFSMARMDENPCHFLLAVMTKARQTSRVATQSTAAVREAGKYQDG